MILRICLLLAFALPLQAAENMIGRQSHNVGISVLPAPGEVTIDGNLDDWDWTGRIWVFADKAVRDRYSVEAAAMWDEDYLYLAAKWLDPTPMYNTVNPAFSPNDGWKADSWQLRINSDRIGHLTTWYYEPDAAPVMHVSYSRGGVGGETFYLKAEDGNDLGRGVQMAYRQVDAKSYIQELRVPWELIYKDVPAIEPGLTFGLGNEFLWGDVTGKTWPVHRYADNLQPGETSREFYWKANKVWGDATLLAEGNVPIRRYIDDDATLPGTQPIRLALPADAVRFTVAINDHAGNRVRNLAGDFDPRDYTVEMQGDQRLVELLWDCLDDAGEPVAPGAYTAIGLSHEGLSAEYDMTYYNPGTPPWRTADGTGAWGSNHAEPLGVARAGDRMIVYWAHSEGGHAIIGLNADGRKIWGELHGAIALAADAQSVYAIAGGSEREHQKLFRLDAKDGTYKPFTIDGANRPLFLPLADLVDEELSGEVAGLASSGEQLAVALSSGQILLLDTQSATPRQTLKLDATPTDVAFAPDGTLHALTAEGAYRWDTDRFVAIPLPGLGQGVSLDILADGRLAVADRGPDSQLKLYTPQGAAAGTIGSKGGRPWSGTFEPGAVMMLSSVAVDAQGQLWAVESWKNPRRVSVWNADGRLVRDYIGNTQYAGTGSWMDPRDASIAYIGPVELRLDHENRDYTVTRLLWVPDASKGEAFPMRTHPHWYSNPQVVYSRAAGGDEIRYIYYNGTYSQWNAVYIDDGTMARPVAAVTNAEYLSKTLPQLDLGTSERSTLVFWNDANGDGAVSRDECQLDTETITSRAMAFWGNAMGNDLSFYLRDRQGFRIEPVGFTDAGAPIYTPESLKPIDVAASEYTPLPDGRVLAFDGHARKGGKLFAFNADNGETLWTYPNPYPGVHGSHRATMPAPGLLIGILKICGVAAVPGQAEAVFAMRGNLGQDFYFTTDGLYVGALFQDGRLPGDALPREESQLIGMPMEGFSEGGEPFSGWFGRHNDGRYRMLTSIARTGALICTIGGFDSIKRFTPVTLDLDDAAIAQALQDNAARQAEAGGATTYTISKLDNAPSIDGSGDDWASVPALTIEREGAPDSATAKLAYDADTLYLLYTVQDPTPWLNEGKDHARLFKTGDAVDLQIGPGSGRDPGPGDQRIVIAKLGKQPAAVLMRPHDPAAPEALRHVYSSPVSDKVFQRLEVLKQARVKVQTASRGYTVEAAIPLAALGLEPASGAELRGDLGFIASDAAGTINVARTYWSNKETNLVNDLPAESWMTPAAWGTLRWQ